MTHYFPDSLVWVTDLLTSLLANTRADKITFRMLSLGWTDRIIFLCYHHDLIIAVWSTIIPCHWFLLSHTSSTCFESIHFYPSTCLLIYLSTNLFISPSTYLPIYLNINLTYSYLFKLFRSLFFSLPLYLYLTLSENVHLILVLGTLSLSSRRWCRRRNPLRCPPRGRRG